MFRSARVAGTGERGVFSLRISSVVASRYNTLTTPLQIASKSEIIQGEHRGQAYADKCICEQDR